ncbi:5-oxoprolinase/urea amidolyase family protein [Sulfobacillus harzensis]|uniref:5-oxoprolinase/urea amidolyase family protein n=1 Tax=Sulfobacillus harzensis TaxID=2729629 RepID=A0A7Y0L6S6_9FIRM|nr:5-oxoprolinase/urea amidolyase family protein [Sulfobacillus harzensis]NMP23786.1 5-oxoprolinase/urea amidolyase family protein [Sulfobacillus harzensis]
MGRIKVVKPGLLTTVQDAGRRGYEHWGVMVGGWLDDWAALWANRLVANPANAALLEVTLMGPELLVEEGGWAALTGADLGASVNGAGWNPGSNRYLEDGDVVRFSRAHRGARTYLAFSGGIAVDPVFESRSTDLVAKFGGIEGRSLRSGDLLFFSGATDVFACKAPVETLMNGGEIRVLPGVRVDAFPATALNRLLAAEYRVSPRSDRVGMRLDGPPVTDQPMPSGGVSEGMAIGAIEVPPSGELLVLLKSRGSIGGYPALAHVIRADWPRLAQLKPGDAVRFRLVDLTEAEVLLDAQMEALKQPLATGGNELAPVETQRTDARVTAPTWAVAYRAASPGGVPLASVGQVVHEGDPLAVLEVMKNFFDVVSPLSGKVVAVSFDDGQEVLEGQELFRIQPFS